MLRRRSSRDVAVVSALLLVMLGVGTACSESQTRVADAAGSADAVADESLAARYARALDELDPTRRHLALADIYAEVLASEGSESIESLGPVIEQDLRRRRPAEIRVFANLLARRNVTSALSDVLAWDEARARTPAAEEVISVWVEDDHVEAVRTGLRDSAASLPEGVGAQMQLAFVVALGRHHRLDALLATLAAEEDITLRRRMVAKATLELSKHGASVYPDWVESIYGDPTVASDLQTELVLQAIKLLLLLDRDRALAWYEKIADGPDSGDALSLIAEKWARTDPRAALEYLNARPASEAPEMAKRAVAFTWLQREPVEAEPYLRERVERDPTMSPVVFPLVQYSMVADIEGAMELAQRVPDEKEREIVLKQGLMRWVQRDPAAVDAYMASHPVPPAVRTAVEGARKLRRNRVSQAGDG